MGKIVTKFVQTSSENQFRVLYQDADASYKEDGLVTFWNCKRDKKLNVCSKLPRSEALACGFTIEYEKIVRMALNQLLSRYEQMLDDLSKGIVEWTDTSSTSFLFMLHSVFGEIKTELIATLTSNSEKWFMNADFTTGSVPIENKINEHSRERSKIMTEIRVQIYLTKVKNALKEYLDSEELHKDVEEVLKKL